MLVPTPVARNISASLDHITLDARRDIKLSCGDLDFLIKECSPPGRLGDTVPECAPDGERLRRLVAARQVADPDFSNVTVNLPTEDQKWILFLACREYEEFERHYAHERPYNLQQRAERLSRSLGVWISMGGIQADNTYAVRVSVIEQPEL